MFINFNNEIRAASFNANMENISSFFDESIRPFIKDLDLNLVKMYLKKRLNGESTGAFEAELEAAIGCKNNAELGALYDSLDAARAAAEKFDF